MKLITTLLLLLSLSCITIERPIVVEPQRCECVCPAENSCPEGAFCIDPTDVLTNDYPCVNCFDMDGAATSTITDDEMETTPATIIWTGTATRVGDCCHPDWPTDETCHGCDTRTWTWDLPAVNPDDLIITGCFGPTDE